MSKYETIGGVATQSEAFAKLIQLLHEAQDQAAMLAHLTRAQGSKKDNALADGWFSVSEMLKHASHHITTLAQGRLN
jgi:hypothetical protein